MERLDHRVVFIDAILVSEGVTGVRKLPYGLIHNRDALLADF